MLILNKIFTSDFSFVIKFHLLAIDLAEGNFEGNYRTGVIVPTKYNNITMSVVRQQRVFWLYSMCRCTY